MDVAEAGPGVLLSGGLPIVGADPKVYAVKELYYTLQGEGVHAGRAAVFVRFAGCNLWSGTAEGRGKGQGGCSAWCDTDFVGTDGPGGGRYTAEQLAQRVADVWQEAPGAALRLVVLTGGEPTLQVDRALIDELHRHRLMVHMESNGTRPAPSAIDWLTVSPKAGGNVVQITGQELKLVYPQRDPELWPFQVENLAGLENWSFLHWLLSPMWVPDSAEWEANKAAAAEYVKSRPQWRLSIQTHKEVGLP